MYGMTPMGVFFTAIFPLVINGQALCQQPHFTTHPPSGASRLLFCTLFFLVDFTIFFPSVYFM